jgi:hypothetical protein
VGASPEEKAPITVVSKLSFSADELNCGAGK